MICKNCNYILSGKESFCPDCGTPCEKDRAYQREQNTPQVIFSPEKEPSSPIFASDVPPVPEHTEKKSRAGLYLIIVLCTVILGTVAVSVTDMVDFTPVIASLLSFSEETTTEEATSPSEYDLLSGIIPPAVNYRTSIAYISGETGQALKKGPDNSYGQIDVLTVGTIIHIVGGEKEKSEWVYVYSPEKDIYGWLSSSYISSSLNIISQEENEVYEEASDASESDSSVSYTQ